MIQPMDSPDHFTGFSPKTHQFFAQLKKNNTRPWFTAHKQDYLDHVLHPARAFVQDIGPSLGRAFPGIVADPTASIFRIYKDTRFSRDKSPYKTHLGIFFWQGPGKKMERPGFYFELDDAGLRLYYGCYQFAPNLLKAYRDAVADEPRGRGLLRIQRSLARSGITVGGQHYKRIPSGYSVAPALENLIKHNTLYTEQDCGKPRELFSPRLIPYCLRQWQRCRPVYDWVRQLDREGDSLQFA